jgi:cytoskeletal protein CcmA (bactofilin family)
MSWFKKPLDGDALMTNPNSSGRVSAPEPSITRPEPREPRVEPRTPPPRAAAEPRAPEPRTPEPRAQEHRLPEHRAPEARAAEARAQEAAPRASVLGPSLRFRGELSAQEDLIIQGSVEGSITHTQSLTVGTDGSMKGDIRARVIVIDGKVEGDLYATESVTIRVTAKVKGNVFAPRVGITEGAFFQGQIEMQPSGAAVQEHSARLRHAALAPPLEGTAVDHMLGSS